MFFVFFASINLAQFDSVEAAAEKLFNSLSLAYTTRLNQSDGSLSGKTGVIIVRSIYTNDVKMIQ